MIGGVERGMNATDATTHPLLRLPATERCRLRRIAIVVAAAAALTAACADKTPHAGPGRTTTTEADGGWIGGAPKLDGGEGDGFAASGREKSAYAEDMASPAESMATAAAPGRADSSVGSGDDPMPTTIAPDGPIDNSPLRAGNVDDNADFDGFVAYLARVQSEGVPFRPLDPSGRIVVHVRDGGGRAASGVKVELRAGARVVVTQRTTADGTTRFHPKALGAGDGPFTVAVGEATVEAAAGSSVEVVGASTPIGDHVPLDIAFAVDITGSMGDELDRLTDSIRSVVDRIQKLPGSADVRLAMTVYRDEGDSFVTATHDFTRNVDEFRTALADLRAGGGGDTPEALDEAVADVLTKPSWRPAGDATQLVFVIGDAGGHPDRKVPTPYTASMQDAASRGIKIIPIAASSTDDQAEVQFRQMAQFTGGRFVFLAYGAGGTATGSSTDIASTDYEELSLDDLVVRLVADEIAARTGQQVDVPPAPATTTTTRPNGQ